MTLRRLSLVEDDKRTPALLKRGPQPANPHVPDRTVYSQPPANTPSAPSSPQARLLGGRS